MVEKVQELVEDVKFGVLFIGAPGVGKSTLCKALSQHMKEISRPHCIINLDSANENIDYECGIDVRELITLEDAMTELQLGPNGATLYCSDFVLANITWLQDQILEFQQRNKNCQYFLIDLPGQVELYAQGNQGSLKKTLANLEQQLNFNFVAVHLIDSQQMYDRFKFLSSLTLSLTAIIGMELPMVNLITKVDLIAKMGRPEMNLMFYEGCTNGLQYLFFDEFETSNSNDQKEKTSSFTKRFSTLTKSLCELIENYNQVSLSLCDITNKLSLTNVLMKIDKSNNYWYQPQRLESEQESKIDYEAVEQYFGSSEWLIDLEDRYFHNIVKDKDEDY